MTYDIDTVYETYRAVELAGRIPCPNCGALPVTLAMSSGRGVLHDLDCGYEVWRFRREAQPRVLIAKAA